MSLTAAEFEARMPDGAALLSDEPEMESSLHYLQLSILVTSLEWYWRERDDYFIGANLSVYYSRTQLRHPELRGPDMFLVRGVDPHPRASWVVWEEGGRYPDLIVELLSPSTADVDRTEKKRLYEGIFHTPEYFWFAPDTLELQGFRLGHGGRYEEITAVEREWRYSETLDLYLGVEDRQLRYFTPDGEKAPTPQEAAREQIARADREKRRADHEQRRAAQEQRRAAQEQRRADHEQRRAAQEHERAERLAEKLRALGIEPDA